VGGVNDSSPSPAGRSGTAPVATVATGASVNASA
jgi:hypothetical protein